jgi:lipid A disaccharide synthetase
MIRQAFGDWAVRYTQRNSQEKKRKITIDVSGLLCALLPGTQKEDIEKFVNKVVTAAIYLKNELSKAQVVYSCYWVKYGDQFDKVVMQANGAPDEDKVWMCTFPGLAKMVENKEAKYIVVKARAVLQGTS